MKLQKNQNYSTRDLANCIRILSADAVEKAKSGHPGMPLGMADVMKVLAFDVLSFNPNDPKWQGRDRLVLSAGHGSMLLYSFYFLAGYEDFSLEDIKNFRQLHSKTSGHPEYGLYGAIETTSGPLGQGFANAVGMAIAAKKYQARLGKDLCDYKIYVIVGDGCLMEGIAYEAASIAGHLRLNNLIVLFDDNSISIDGKTNLTVSEDHLAKFSSLGFEVDQIDGHNEEQIHDSFMRAKNATKPTFISCKTVIGKGAKEKCNSEKVHGSPLGLEEIEYMKKTMSFPNEAFAIPAELKKEWEEAWLRNLTKYENWQNSYNSLFKEDKNYLDHHLPVLPKEIGQVTEHNATRISSGMVVELLMKHNDKVVCGSADLAISNGLKNPSCKMISADDFSGNFIHYGVREHAMAGIMNGLSLSGFFPISGTFFVFSDYMRPSIRLSAMMKLPMIYVMTHDSIGVGEDGPTHQPVEHLASFRAMPSLKLYRPADFAETLEAYELMIRNQGPSMIVLTRQNVQQLRSHDLGLQNLSKKGGYVIYEGKRKEADIVIFASGSEVLLAKEVQDILQEQTYSVHVVSVPCFTDYIQNMPKDLYKPGTMLVAIEAASSFGWHRIIGQDGMFFGVEDFGLSAPSKELNEYFGLNSKNIAQKISNRLQQKP